MSTESRPIAPEFMSVIRARRSIREFAATPVPEEAIAELLEAASLAPSSCNRQPWRFVLVRDRQLLAKMGGAVKARFDELRAKVPPDELTEEMESFRVFFSFFETAPLVVVACYREMPDLLARIVSRAGGAAVDTVTGIHPELQSLSLAVMSLVLAATNRGLATSVTTGPLIAKETLKELLGLSRHWEIATLVPVGYAASEPGERPRRKDLSQIVSFL